MKVFNSFKMAENMEGKTPVELLALGSKAYWLHNHADAVAYLSKSSEMLVEEHKDDKHDSLGNVYLIYGKALLELAREAGDPLGDGVPKEIGFEEEVSDEEDDDAEGDEAEAGEGEKTQEDKPEEAKTEGEKNDKEAEPKKAKKSIDNKTDDAKAADISINGEAASSSTVENGDDSKMEEGEDEEEEDEGVEEDGEEVVEEGEDGETVEKEEEPTDLQLAWEVLELAKVIFERRADKGKEDFADCLVTLGEVSLESENFDSAITDIETGLEIQKGLYKESKDMRKLAETYYKLGMAHSAHNKIDEGIEDYKITSDILKKRLKELEDKEAPGSSDAEEIKEIKALLPELDDKVSDLKTVKEEENAKPEEEPPMVSSPEKKATDISHLVKRKRKLVEDDKLDDKVTKKIASSSPSSSSK